MFVTPRTSLIVARESRGRSGVKRKHAVLGRSRVLGKRSAVRFRVADAKGGLLHGRSTLSAERTARMTDETSDSLGYDRKYSLERGRGRF
jgi:hypothetical protein